jgi:hypothetical protein
MHFASQNLRWHLPTAFMWAQRSPSHGDWAEGEWEAQFDPSPCSHTKLIGLSLTQSTSPTKLLLDRLAWCTRCAHAISLFLGSFGLGGVAVPILGLTLALPKPRRCEDRGRKGRVYPSPIPLASCIRTRKGCFPKFPFGDLGSNTPLGGVPSGGTPHENVRIPSP